MAAVDMKGASSKGQGPGKEFRAIRSQLDSLPVAPKLRGNNAIVTTKLCEPKFKSTKGLFDVSFPQECHGFRSGYNSLHDPSLKAYFYRPDLKKKLIKNGFVTKDLYVKSSLREYNEYRRFLEAEFMKVKKKREVYEQETQKDSCMQKVVKCPTEVEREQKRNEFFQQQEEKLILRQEKLRKSEREEALLRSRKEEQQVMRKVEIEIQIEDEMQQKQQKQQKHLKDRLAKEKSKKLKLRRTSELECQRIVNLKEEKRRARVKHAKEMEVKWLRWERHRQEVMEEEVKKKKLEEAEKQRRMEKRKALYQISQTREEEQRTVLSEQIHSRVGELKYQYPQLTDDEDETELGEWESARGFGRRNCSSQHSSSARSGRSSPPPPETEGGAVAPVTEGRQLSGRPTSGRRCSVRSSRSSLPSEAESAMALTSEPKQLSARPTSGRCRSGRSSHLSAADAAMTTISEVQQSPSARPKPGRLHIYTVRSSAGCSRPSQVSETAAAAGTPPLGLGSAKHRSTRPKSERCCSVRSSRSSVFSETEAAMTTISETKQLSARPKSSRQVRFRTTNVCIPPTIAENDAKADLPTVRREGRTSLEGIEEQPATDPSSSSDTELNVENLLISQKAEELVCDILSQAIKPCNYDS